MRYTCTHVIIVQNNDKYAGEKGFTSININPEMFKMLSSMDMNDSSEKAQEAQNVMEQVTGLKMLVYEPDEGETNVEFLNEIKTLTKVEGFEEMMSVNEGDEVVKFLVKKGKDGKMSEMVESGTSFSRSILAIVCRKECIPFFLFR